MMIIIYNAGSLLLDTPLITNNKNKNKRKLAEMNNNKNILGIGIRL